MAHVAPSFFSPQELLKSWKANLTARDLAHEVSTRELRQYIGELEGALAAPQEDCPRGQFPLNYVVGGIQASYGHCHYGYCHCGNLRSREGYTFCDPCWHRLPDDILSGILQAHRARQTAQAQDQNESVTACLLSGYRQEALRWLREHS